MSVQELEILKNEIWNLISHKIKRKKQGQEFYKSLKFETWDNHDAYLRYEIEGNHVKSLGINNFGLETLPLDFNIGNGYNDPKVFNLLERLDLSNNHLSAIPNFVSELKQIISLSMNHNNITSIDNLNLRTLRHVHFSHNKIESVDNSFENVSDLTFLSLAYNKLTQFPVISSFNNMVDLDLSHNKIKLLPDEINNLTNLTTLSISNNPLNKFEIDFKKLNNLRLLALDKHQFKLLSEEQRTHLENSQVQVIKS